MAFNLMDEVEVVACKTDWGQWWQNVHEVHVEINLPQNTTKKDITVTIKCTFIKIVLKDKVLIEGNLHKTIHADEAIWTLEDSGKLLNVVLPKAEYDQGIEMWSSLLANGDYEPDVATLHKMREKLDLEKFQIEYPGMDFRNAKLSKSYDKLPGET